METKNIQFYQMLIMYGLVSVPFFLIISYKIPLLKQAAVSLLRMSLQLSLVGVYLGFIFKVNNLWLNFLWVLIMLLVANYTVLKNTGLNIKLFFPWTFIGIAAGTGGVALYFIQFAICPKPFYTAQYLIPITGMIMGNSLRANVISLERFYGSIKKNQQEFLTFLTMGASLKEAILPYLKEALKATLAPAVSTMSTMGIVSLPGMMTGQILGGSVPLVAIKYQIAIMLAIFCAISISSILNVLLSLKVAFNDYQILRKDIFVN